MMFMLRRPVPWEQRGDICNFVIVDAREHIGEPGLRIDSVQPRGLDQRIHDRSPLAAPVRAREQL